MQLGWFGFPLQITWYFLNYCRKTIHSQTFPKGLTVFPRKFICEWNRSLCGEQRLKMNFYICSFLIWTQIISGVRSLLDKWPSLELREAAAQFLGKCGSKDIPEHLEVRSQCKVYVNEWIYVISSFFVLSEILIYSNKKENMKTVFFQK